MRTRIREWYTPIPIAMTSITGTSMARKIRRESRTRMRTSTKH